MKYKINNIIYVITEKFDNICELQNIIASLILAKELKKNAKSKSNL